MKKIIILLGAIASALLFFSGCAVNSTGNADASFDGLVPITVAGLDSAWAREGVRLSGYTKIMMTDAEIQYRPAKAAALQYDAPLTQTEYPISEEGQKKLKTMLMETFTRELNRSHAFTLVQEAGPDVLTVKVSLLDVVSMTPPKSSGKSVIFLDDIGEATMVIELFDSQSNTILARAIDREAIDSPAWNGPSEALETWPEVEKGVAAWASILRSELESVKLQLASK